MLTVFVVAHPSGTFPIASAPSHVLLTVFVVAHPSGTFVVAHLSGTFPIASAPSHASGTLKGLGYHLKTSSGSCLN